MQKKITKWSSFIPAILCATLLNAQHNKSLVLPAISAASTVITQIKEIGIVSHLPDSVFLGIQPSAILNTRENIIAPKGVNNLLQTYLHGVSFSTAGASLLWNVNDFSMGIDSSGERVITYVKLAADILKNIGMETYQSLGNFDTLIVTGSQEADLEQNAASAIDALLHYSALLAVNATVPKALDHGLPLSNGSSSWRTLTKKSLLQDIQKANDWKICSDTVYVAGIYRTFDEFKSNAPSVREFRATVDTDSKRIMLYRFSTVDSSSQLLPDAWGVSINNELYRYKGGQLYPIEKNGGGFFLSKYLDLRQRKNQAFFWRRYIGERQGDNNPFNDKHLYRVAVDGYPGVMIEAIKLNPGSGELDF